MKRSQWDIDKIRFGIFFNQILGFLFQDPCMQR